MIMDEHHEGCGMGWLVGMPTDLTTSKVLATVLREKGTYTPLRLLKDSLDHPVCTTRKKVLD